METIAAIFDWDGVIIDSSRAHEIAWDRLGAETGRPLPDGHFKAGFGRYFATIVAADDVTRGKPDPQVFLLGAERLGVRPARCVVFEDAFAGLEAARAGGMKAVGVATTHPAERLRPHADRVVARLDELSPADLRQLVG